MEGNQETCKIGMMVTRDQEFSFDLVFLEMLGDTIATEITSCHLATEGAWPGPAPGSVTCLCT